jgi:hypothetical protein
MLRDFSRTRPGRPIPFAPSTSLDEKSNIFRVKGVFGGSISVVGPLHDKIIGIPDATRSWKVTLSGSEGGMEKMRKKNEAFMRVLLGLGNKELVKIQPIDTQFSSFCLSSEATRKEMPESFASLGGMTTP